VTVAAPWAELAETHSAIVVFAGDRAYKLKKPVAFDFLDFSTRELREQAVHREVELNRRIAPDVYLGVADVLGVDGEVCDHLVVMRRLPADRRLSALVKSGTVTDDDLRALARVVAVFHAGARRDDATAAAGAPESISSKLARDLGELQRFARSVFAAETLD
jgi:aminoglycoside phosphotransferase family enzyme